MSSFHSKRELDLSNGQIGVILLIYRYGVKPHQCEFEHQECAQSATPRRPIRTPRVLAKNLITTSRLLTRQFLSLRFGFDGFEKSLSVISVATRLVKHLHLIITLRELFDSSEFWSRITLQELFDPHCVIWVAFEDQRWPQCGLFWMNGSREMRMAAKRVALRTAQKCVDFWMDATPWHQMHLGLLHHLVTPPPLPSQLTRLSLGKRFNRNLRGKLPLTLRHLSVTSCFDQTFDPNDLPNLRHFHVSHDPESHLSDHRAMLASLPADRLGCLQLSLFHMRIDPSKSVWSYMENFFQIIDRFTGLRKLRWPTHLLITDLRVKEMGFPTVSLLPDSVISHPVLKSLTIFTLHQQKIFIDSNCWRLGPSSFPPDRSFLVSLFLPENFHGPLPSVWPSTLRRLIFHDRSSFSPPTLVTQNWPPHLTTLFFNNSFSCHIDVLVTRTPHLKRLRLGSSFDRPILCLPPELIILIVGDTPLCSERGFPSVEVAKELEPLSSHLDLLGRANFSCKLSSLPPSLRLVLVGRNKTTPTHLHSISCSPRNSMCSVIGRTDLLIVNVD